MIPIAFKIDKGAKKKECVIAVDKHMKISKPTFCQILETGEVIYISKIVKGEAFFTRVRKKWQRYRGLDAGMHLTPLMPVGI